MEAGADLCAQSTHKIIGAMTQASMLHAQGTRVDLAKLANVLRFIQTTSPSYILMASLDLARMQMATEGEKLLDKAIGLAEEARASINRIPGLSCFGEEYVRSIVPPMGGLDVTKLTITVKDLGVSGHHVAHLLNTRYAIQVEMADPFHVLVIVSIGDRREDLLRLTVALQDIAQTAPPSPGQRKAPHTSMRLPLFMNPVAMTPRDAFFADQGVARLSEAAGRISAEIVTVYPPGTPILVPGEIVSEEARAYLEEALRLGATVDGLDETNSLLTVVK